MNSTGICTFILNFLHRIMAHRVDNCLNCGHPLENSYNFCPECGQENTSQLLSIKNLIVDFLNNYFAFDSKLGRSIHHFFLRPGFLTLRFNEGKRVRYVHPLRLYLVISVFFFFMLTYLLTLQLEDSSIQKIASETPENADIKAQVQLTDSIALAELQEVKRQNPGMLPPSDSLFVAENKAEDKGLRQVVGWLRDESLTDAMVVDSLNTVMKFSEKRSMENSSFSLFIRQSRRVVQKDLDVFIPYVLKNLPLMMFLLLPVFALYLKFLFRNKPNLYIRHIIHALHLHSMAFFLLTLFLLIGWLSNAYFFWITFWVVTIYAFLSIKNVYQQRWLRSLWKFSLLGILYFSTLFIFILTETALSFFTF